MVDKVGRDKKHAVPDDQPSTAGNAPVGSP